MEEFIEMQLCITEVRYVLEIQVSASRHLCLKNLHASLNYVSTQSQYESQATPSLKTMVNGLGIRQREWSKSTLAMVVYATLTTQIEGIVQTYLIFRQMRRELTGQILGIVLRHLERAVDSQFFVIRGGV